MIILGEEIKEEIFAEKLKVIVEEFATEKDERKLKEISIIGSNREETDANIKRYLSSYEEQLIKGASWDLTVGTQYFKWSEQSNFKNKDGQNEFEFEKLKTRNEDIVIYPGELIIIKSREFIFFPGDISGIIQSYVSLVSIGLSAVSTTIDPQFKGHLAIALKNNGRRQIKLNHKDPIATMILFKHHKNTSIPYEGSQQGLKDLNKVITTNKVMFTSEKSCYEEDTRSTWEFSIEKIRNEKYLLLNSTEILLKIIENFDKRLTDLENRKKKKRK